MKRFVFSIFLCIGLCFNVSAQITKSDILQMMEDVGTSAEKMNQIYIGNTMSYYKDGTSKQGYSIYTAEKGNIVSFTDNGIRINWKPEGTLKSVVYIPYTSIISFNIGADYMDIYILK